MLMINVSRMQLDQCECTGRIEIDQQDKAWQTTLSDRQVLHIGVNE